LHIVQVFEISFLVSLMLVAIAAIGRPFQGQVRVTPEAFQCDRHNGSTWPQQ